VEWLLFSWPVSLPVEQIGGLRLLRLLQVD
jgi:hypothetical protein